jgi:hypothetical protein
MKLAPAALCAGFCAAAFSQTFDTFRANIAGSSSDRGKCTVEVVVDGVAEVEVVGSQGRMRTSSGARSAWRRLDCSMPLPKNPAGFKFTPQKKNRGKQTLLSAPSGNQAAAVVRIEDPETGSAPYKFELEWRGVTSGFEQGGLNSGGLKSDAGEPRQGGIIDGGSLAGWDDHVEFRGAGDGYYQSFQGTDEVLSDCEVLIERSGHVQVRLKTKGKDPLMLSGRLVKADNKKLVANISGGSIVGPMEIERDSRNHIKNLSMSGEGRNKFELRWRSDK